MEIGKTRNCVKFRYRSDTAQIEWCEKLKMFLNVLKITMGNKDTVARFSYVHSHTEKLKSL